MARGKGFPGLWLALALVVGPAAAVVSAAEWGGISPGISTTETVRARYGAPSREARQKVEGYDTVQWVYEGSRAPTGMKRLTVEFGMVTSGRYQPNLVRFFILEPHRGVFDRVTIVNGWGFPDGVGEKDGRKTFFYRDGLEVYLDDTGEDTLSMVFLIPQPEAKAADK